MARLILVTTEGTQAIELAQTNSVGRHPGNTIQLLDKIVSKEHCVLELRAGQFVLRDLNSLNGAFVNDVRVQAEQALRHGDQILLGSTQMRFDDGYSPPSYPLPAISQGAAVNPQPLVGRRLTPNPFEATDASPAWRWAPTAGQAPPAQPQMRPAPTSAHVSMSDGARQIGAQVSALAKGFLPFDQIQHDPVQLGMDYERLRITWELTRDIGLEHDLDALLGKILLALFKFVNADRGVILLKEADGTLRPRATHRRDRSGAAIQVSSTILAHVIREKTAVLTHDASMDFAASQGKSMYLNRISSAIVVPLLHEAEVIGALWLDSESLAQFMAKDLELITAVANQAAMFIENNLLAKKIEREIVTRERFSRLLSPNVAEQVVSGQLEVKKGGVSVPSCTVFNSDIRGFTRMSEGASAELMVEILNEYFELMVETIFKYEGTLDKFMGDGIMAFWGAPAMHPDDPVRAIRCALEQMEVLSRFNRGRMQSGFPPLEIGIGVHTGRLVSGYVGSSRSLSYTVIGDTVNTSARLCGIAAAGQIIVSEQTAELLGNGFVLEELAPAHLKGKEKPMRIFNVRR